MQRVAQRDAADMGGEAGQHLGDDEIGDEDDDQRRDLQRRLAFIARRRHPGLFEHPVPEKAEAEGEERGDEGGNGIGGGGETHENS